MPLWRIADVMGGLPALDMETLPAPAPPVREGSCVGLAVASMQHHTSDEGWQIFEALAHAGYTLHGHTIGPSWTNVRDILWTDGPGTVLVQDQREWEGRTAGKGFDERERFHEVESLKDSGCWVGTLLKDAHRDPAYHAQSAREMGAHFIVCYYHPRIVHHLAPWTCPEHLVRTYHTVDASLVPDYTPQGRAGCLLSGAISSAYPLRQSLVRHAGILPRTTVLPHPGYHRRGTHTPAFLQTLSHYQVAICTASRYGYALRKIIEATACGCVVLTDLPEDEILPHIDGNLVRVHPQTSPRVVARMLRTLYDQYDPARQEHFARLARTHYDYREEGVRLAYKIEELRRRYP